MPAALFAAPVLIALALGGAARAATLLWDADGGSGPPQGGSGPWDTTSLLWDDGGVMVAWNNATPDSALLMGTAGTLSLGASITCGTITFNTAGYVLNTAGNGLSAATLTGTAAFTKDGAGVMTLTGNSGHSGGITISGGTVDLNNGGSGPQSQFSGAAGSFATGPGGTLRITTSGTGVDGNSYTLSRAVTGNGALTISHVGTGAREVRLTGPGGSFTGTLNMGTTANQNIRLTSFPTLASGAVLNLTERAQVWSGYMNGLTLTVDINQANANNTQDGLGSIRISGSTHTLNGTITISGAQAKIDGTGTAGVINSLVGGAGKLVLGGWSAGSVFSLMGANGYGGGTDISQGRVRVGNNGALGGGLVTFVHNNAVLSSDGAAARTLANALQFNSNATLGHGTDNGKLTVNGPVSLNAGMRALTTPSDVELAGAVSSGGITKLGAGTLTLSGANSYASGTELQGGVLVVNALSGIGSGYLAVKNGSTFRYAGAGSEATARPLWLDLGAAILEITSPTGVLTWNDGSAKNQAITKTGAGTLVLGGAITGAGSLLVDGGTMTLGGACSYSGPTAVAAGTLRLGAANVLPSGAGRSPVMLSGGTLDLNGFSAGINGLNGGGVVDNTGAGAVTLTVGLGDASSSFGGTIRNTGGALGLTKAGAGILTLASSNLTYSGPTTVSGGTLRLQGAPVAPAAGLHYWLDASSAGSVVYDGANNVSAWNDIGGRRLNFTQGTAAYQPDFVAGVLNGRPVVRFDRDTTNQVLLGTLTRPKTVFAVNTVSAFTGLDGIFGLNGGDKGIRLQSGIQWQAVGNADDFTNPEGTMFVNGTPGSTFGGLGVPHVLTAVHGSNVNTNYTSTGVGGYYAAAAGGNRFFEGDIAEVIVYETTLSASDRAMTESYLRAKWLGTSFAMFSHILPTATALAVAGGAKLDLDGVAQAVGTLTGAGSVTNSGTGASWLDVGGNGASGAFAGSIGGALLLTKSGGGAVSLSGASDYAGPTLVSNGTLRVDNTVGSGTGTGIVVVAGGGTLGGTGIVAGSVVVNPGGKFAAGNSVGTNTVGSLTLAAGSTFEVEADGAAADQTISLGPVDLGGATLSTVALSAPTFTSALILSNATGQITGYFAGLGESAPVMIGAAMYFIHYRPTYVELNLSPTEVVLHQFGAIAEGAGVVVRWRTASEVRTAGFDLYRKVDGEWVKVNGALIAATGAPRGGVGASYAIADAGAAAGGTYEYKLVEVEQDGSQRAYGPYERTATAFELTSPIRATPEGMEIRWLSREGERYRVLRATDLRNPVFDVVAGGIEAAPPENVFLDTNAAPLRVYRVEMEE